MSDTVPPGCQQCGRTVDRWDIHMMERRADGAHRYWHEHCWYTRGTPLAILLCQAFLEETQRRYAHALKEETP